MISLSSKVNCEKIVVTVYATPTHVVRLTLVLLLNIFSILRKSFLLKAPMMEDEKSLDDSLEYLQRQLIDTPASWPSRNRSPKLKSISLDDDDTLVKHANLYKIFIHKFPNFHLLRFVSLKGTNFNISVIIRFVRLAFSFEHFLYICCIIPRRLNSS